MTIRHDVNKVQALYIAALIQAARKVCAQLQANGGIKRTPLAAFENELLELFQKTEQLTEFERSPQAREGLHFRSDSPELLHVLEKAMNYMAQSPEIHSAMEIDDADISGMFDLAEEKPAEPTPTVTETVKQPADEMDAFSLGETGAP